jgi:acetoin utilization deacetylase AcuC-like enzyme
VTIPSGRSTAIESSLAEHGWLGYEAREAPPASREILVAAHSAEYVDAVRSMSDSGGGAFDQENIVSGGSYRAAVHASGAACAIVEALLAGGQARVGFCATRPPGHHARADTTSGFCLFNRVAVASRHALDSLGARRVFICDWDVHRDDEQGGCELEASSFAEMARYIRGWESGPARRRALARAA